MTEPLKVAILGAGSRGRSVYGAYALAHPDQMKVVAVAEPIASRREAFAAEHSLSASACFAHWADLLQAPGGAQAVIVATNDRDHVGPAVAFLEAGFHLLLEKPMAPDIEGCRLIVAAAEAAQGMSAVCHVLRYTPYFRKMRELIEQGLVGRPVTLRHLEPVNFWHFAHSFVRGNWRRDDTTSPFILAKSCHDMDIMLYLTGQQPRTLQSLGSLAHFHPSQAPPGAARRCLDCPCEVETRCPYSARRFYGDQLKRGEHGWPLDVVTDDFTSQGLERALRDGPYGRCVYHCDNNVCDHQVVALEFEDGLTATFTATAFTDGRNRETEVLGTHGSLRGDGQTILFTDFRDRTQTRYTVESQGHHLGGDEAMLAEFITAVLHHKPDQISTSPSLSLTSHLMALYAEQARLDRETKFFSRDLEESRNPRDHAQGKELKI